MRNVKCKHLILSLIIIGIIVIAGVNYSFSYSRRIGNTRFYLITTMSNSKEGKPLAGLFYKPTATSGYNGENTPGFPISILWNGKYLISKNFDGNNPTIISYIVINMDSIKTDYGEMTDIHTFVKEEDYNNYLKQMHFSESDMNQTDNHIAWWEKLF